MFKELEDKNFQKELNEILKNGGVIAFVTDTVWGVRCLTENLLTERSGPLKTVDFDVK